MFGAPASRFFECWLSIGPMTDDGHHGEGKHDERDGDANHARICLIMVKPKLILGCLEAVLNCPAMAFDADKCLD